MSKIKQLAAALALKGLTLDDTRDLKRLTPTQIDAIRAAYAEVTRPATVFAVTYATVLGWFAALGKKPPPDMRLRPGESADDDALDTVFTHAMKARRKTEPQHLPDPLSLPTKDQEGVLWAVLFTLGHMRREAWKRELREDPMTMAEFDAEMVSL